MDFLNSFLFHNCIDIIPLFMIVHLKFNLLYDLSVKYTMKNASGVTQPLQRVIGSTSRVVHCVYGVLKRTKILSQINESSNRFFVYW